MVGDPRAPAVAAATADDSEGDGIAETDLAAVEPAPGIAVEAGATPPVAPARGTTRDCSTTGIACTAIAG